MIEIDKLDKPEGVLTWFGDTILTLVRESKEKEKPSVTLNALSRSIDSWNRLYSSTARDQRIDELNEKLNEVLRDLGTAKLKAVNNE